MNRSELESKALAELHELAAKAQVPRYRMLRKTELIEQLLDGDGDGGGEASTGGSEASPRRQASPKEAAPARAGDAQAAERPPRRRRRRRRFRRGPKQVRVHQLLLPPPGGRQVLVHAGSREECTKLLREVAAELGNESKGPDPVALLVDPSPEEIADWRREAPEAEIVAAGKPQHADDALGQAVGRAAGGEDVILLIDSLTRLAEAYRDAGAAQEFFDSARPKGSDGSLTVVAAIERTDG